VDRSGWFGTTRLQDMYPAVLRADEVLFGGAHAREIRQCSSQEVLSRACSDLRGGTEGGEPGAGEAPFRKRRLFLGGS